MGGPILFMIVNASLLLANMGSGMASQLGAARLLYAMGQDGALPRRFFGAVHPKTQVPRNNVLLIGVICLCGALLLSYQLGTELLNYGALLAFMGVNFASALRAWRTGRFAQWFPILLSLGGLATCALLWWSLGPLAKTVGTGWALTGVLFWIVRRNITSLPEDAA
jgi:amino acid transporter